MKQKEKERKRGRNLIIIGTLLIVAGAIIYCSIGDPRPGSALLPMGFVLIFTGIWLLRTKGIVVDERYMEIERRSSNDAFWTLIGFISVLLGISIYFPEFIEGIFSQPREFLILLIVVGVFSRLILRYYYKRKV